jgi:hypothetical protein
MSASESMFARDGSRALRLTCLKMCEDSEPPKDDRWLELQGKGIKKIAHISQQGMAYVGRFNVQHFRSMIGI